MRLWRRFIDNSRLAHLQAALARLYTDAAVREELRCSPEAFAARFGLEESEVAGLVREVLGEVEDFARALHRKRFHEAMRALPRTREILGVRLAALFDEYAAATPLGAARNPALDALAFVQWLLAAHRAGLSAADGDALRYECAWLTMQHTSRRALVRWLLVPGAAGGSRVCAVWWRWRGRLRHWANAKLRHGS